MTLYTPGCAQVAAMFLLLVALYGANAFPFRPALDQSGLNLHSVHTRSIDSELDSADAPSPVRKDGKSLGSLLLKNLRFRDLEDILQEESMRGGGGWPAGRGSAYSGGKLDISPEEGMTGRRNSGLYFIRPSGRHGMSKRNEVSVSELAQILSNLKARNIEDDGVKLQSLRFGK